MAGYTYFPPGVTSGGSTGTNSEAVETLQRCLWAPAAGDRTVTVDGSEFNRTATLYYKMVGGDGGAGPTGGGGGSSAILLNGTVQAVAPGANGNTVAAEKVGAFKIKPGDVLRFITGGAGGSGLSTVSLAIGGGGGAGFQGGGGGASITSRPLKPADSPNAAGKGGSNTPGAGGIITGGQAGTAGSGMNGGIGTFPDGSTVTYGSRSTMYSAQITYSDYFGELKSISGAKWPATSSQMGAPISSMSRPNYYGGAGGMLGSAGVPAMELTVSTTGGASMAFRYDRDALEVLDNRSAVNAASTKFFFPKVENFPAHTSDMNLTRVYPTPPANNAPYYTTGGNFPGQIITMYQAEMCGILK